MLRMLRFNATLIFFAVAIPILSHGQTVAANADKPFGVALVELD